MDRRLKGRTAVVTGASSGIGGAIARRFASEGARVALVARRGERLTDLESELRAQGGDVHAVVGDVRDRDSLRDVAQAVRSTCGRVDCLVNNAGVMLLSYFEKAPAEESRTMMETNLMGPVEATAAFVEQMTDGGGDVVVISSSAGGRARPGSALYSATKAGLNAWADGLRQEVADRGVRVIVVKPGAVYSELTDHISDPQLREKSQQTRGRIRALDADDVARVVAFAVSQPEHVSMSEVLLRPTQQK